MTDPDIFVLQLEALAIAARLRRNGDPQLAELLEAWAQSNQIADQLRPTN